MESTRRARIAGAGLPRTASWASWEVLVSLQHARSVCGAHREGVPGKGRLLSGSSKVNAVPCQTFPSAHHKPMTCGSAVPEGTLLGQEVFRICFLVKTEGPPADRKQEAG